MENRTPLSLLGYRKTFLITDGVRYANGVVAREERREYMCAVRK